MFNFINLDLLFRLEEIRMEIPIVLSRTMKIVSKIRVNCLLLVLRNSRLYDKIVISIIVSKDIRTIIFFSNIIKIFTIIITNVDTIIISIFS